MELFTISAPQCRRSLVLWQQNNANTNHINISFFVRIRFFFLFFFLSSFMLACRVVCCSYQSDRRIWVCISHQSDCGIGICSGGSRPWAKGGPGFLICRLPCRLFFLLRFFFLQNEGGARAPLVIPSCNALSFHQGIHGVLWRDQTTAARGTTASVAPVDFIFA